MNAWFHRLRNASVSADAVMECGILLLICAVNAVLIALQLVTPDSQNVITVLLLSSLTYLAWLRFGGGMHPCFLFLALLMLFQGGRLLAGFFHLTDSAFRVDLQTYIPWDAEPAAVLMTLLILQVSAVMVYVPCRLSFVKREYVAGGMAMWANYALILFFLTLPFHFYKNLKYLQYVMEHGYVAIYLGNDEHIQQVGNVVRLISQICVAAFTFYFAWVPTKRRLMIALIPFALATVMELAIGLRGKSLLLFFSFFFFYKVKFNQHFRLARLALIVAGVAVVSVAVASFREKREEDPSKNPLALFLMSQGVSFQVTEVSVAKREQFQRDAWHYLVYPLQGGFRTVSNFNQGERLTIDLSVYLNAESYSMGYATGSSYLAEAYLIGGVFGVMLVSALLGCYLSMISRWLADWRAPFALMIMISAIYVPRAEMVDPIAAPVKQILALLVVLGAVFVMDTFTRYWTRAYAA